MARFNPGIVFVLGAGASVEAGVPVMNNFLNKALELRGDAIYREEFDLTFRAIEEIAAYAPKCQVDTTNLETVFSAFEMAEVVGQLGNLSSDETNRLCKSLKLVIFETLERIAYADQKEDWSLVAGEPYPAFANLVSYLRAMGEPITIISFNYDLCVELAFDLINQNYHYWLESPERYSGNPDLLKMHGSMNWIVEPSKPGKRFTVVKPRRSVVDLEPRSRKMPLTVRAVMEEMEAPCDPVPFIIPPSFNKWQQYSQIRNVWSRAASQLQKADTIYFIGFSIPPTDAFFHQLFLSGSMSSLPHQRIRVINPDTSGITQARYEAMVGTTSKQVYEYWPITFREALPLIGRELCNMDVQWILDKQYYT